MTTALRLVFSTPPDGVEDTAYDAWYEEHVRDVLLVPGYEAVRRYRVTAFRTGRPPTGHRFLTVYEQGPRPADIRAHLATLGLDRYPDWFPRLAFASWDCALRPAYRPPALTDALFLALSSPPDGVDAGAYDAFYGGHLLENVAVDGIDGGCRYAVTPVGGDAPRDDALTHLALYQLGAPMSRVRASLAAARSGMALPPWFDAIRFASVDAVALGPRVAAKETSR